MLLHEFLHARGEDLFLHAGLVALAADVVEEMREFRAAPEAVFKVVRRFLGAADHEVFLEDHRPAHERERDQDDEHALDDDARVGDEGNQGEIGADGIHDGEKVQFESVESSSETRV